MKYIQLKQTRIPIINCGNCPFFQYDSFYGEYHKCTAIKNLIVDIMGIPELCPLEEDGPKPSVFVRIIPDGTKFKGCDTWRV